MFFHCLLISFVKIVQSSILCNLTRGLICCLLLGGLIKGDRADVFVYCLDLLINILKKNTFFNPLLLEQIFVLKTQLLHYFDVFLQLIYLE